MNKQYLIRLVDDDPSVLRAMSFLLRVEGYGVQCYESAEAFLSNDAPSQPGLVVVDLKMPGMDGMELLSELRRREFLHPVVFLTAHGDIDIAVLAVKAGAFDFLQKPLDPPRFLDTVHRALE